MRIKFPLRSTEVVSEGGGTVSKLALASSQNSDPLKNDSDLVDVPVSCPRLVWKMYLV
jgi:hypothetical protein